MFIARRWLSPTRPRSVAVGRCILSVGIGVARSQFLLLRRSGLVERVRVAILRGDRRRTRFSGGERGRWRLAITSLTITRLICLRRRRTAIRASIRRFLLRSRVRRRCVRRHGHVRTNAGLSANSIQHRDVLIRVLETLKSLDLTAFRRDDHIRWNSFDVIKLSQLTLLAGVDFDRDETRC